MPLQFSMYVVPLALAAVVSAVLAAAVYGNQNKRTATQLLAILVATFIWAGADAVKLAVTDPASKLLWHNVRFLGSTLVVLAVLLHALEYTGRSKWLSRGSIAGLGMILAATNVLAWGDYFVTSGLLDGLVYAGFETARVGSATVIDVQYGPWFFVNAVYSYVLLLGAMGMYVSEFLQRTGTYRRQTGGLIVALAVPWAMNGIYLAGFSPIDLTAFGFTVTAVAFFAQFYWFRLLDVVPVARSTAIEHIDSGYLVVDTESRVLDANEAGAGLFGIAPDEAIGRTIQELTEASAALVETDDGVGGDETVTVVREGERRYYDVDTSAVYDGRDQPIGRVVLIHDVTEQRRRQQTLQERTRELERQNEKLDRFASIVSHDLRNPLSVADAELEKVRKSGESPDYDRMQEAIDRMDDITEDVLELARQSEATVDHEPVNLARLCDRAWDTVDTGRTVRADPGRLRQALENLFQNAVEHGPRGVTVRVGDLTEGFYVEDDGPGIPPHLREEVFDHGFTSTDHATGLGLAIVSRTADAHGWDVEIGKSQAGGAKFQFTGVEEADTDVDGLSGDSGELVKIGGFVFGEGTADDEAPRPASR
ncbi:histidine kinase N-terminal 7TM domain-containing protein [Natronomonas marina]|uniref:histidine kinase N-terminal 7TM domain-containing protein n=1 Tax=Natronomonas marina TaxID=2961939 RepID=UPI0020C9A752|nr:histidine kinase N-terminal 7TM domain-containing protein [Natronomonas marina]